MSFIRKRRMSKWVELVAGAGVGALASEILKLLITEAKIVLAFKSVSKDLASTMEDLLPILTTIESLQNPDELKTLMDTISRAGELVCICSGVKGWELHKKTYYTRKVWKIQKEMVSFCQVQLQLIQLRNQLQSMEEISKLKILTEEINNNHQIVINELQRLLMVEENQNHQIVYGKFGHTGGKIVHRMSVPAPVLRVLCSVPKFYKAPVRFDWPLMELKKKLLDDTVESLLVYGPPWCGKTTLVTQLCHDEDIKGKFKHIFFNVVSSTPNFRKLVNDLLQHNGDETRTTFKNDSQIRFALKTLLEKLGKDGPILLVFDDVWSEAESLLEDFSIDIPDLKILVTSRFHFPGFDTTYHLKPLKDEDATALLVQCDPASLVEYEERLQNWMKGNLVGRGTFGSVYLGCNSETGALCAMKEVELFPDDPKSAECIKQLEQEIRLLNNLQHPNIIVQYFGSEIVEDRFVIYMEYALSSSKDKYIRGTMTESVVRNFTRDILSGLAYLHNRKTVHGDLKGANLLVNDFGVVKLADFGMAKHFTRQRADLSLKGSTYWMAPELMQGVMQEDSNPDLVFAVDIWSLGCTIIELLTGSPPRSEFEGVVRDSPPVPESMSLEGKDFLRLCSQRNPAERPTASMLLEHRFVKNFMQPT